jgi:hypothetical protein
MKRLGIFTGRIYDEEDFWADCIKECCRVLKDEEAEDISVITSVYTREHINCIGCNGCPESQR